MQTLPLRLDGSEVMAVLEGFRTEDEKVAVDAGLRPKPKPEARSMLDRLMRGLSG